jgi:hypothetical protein
MRVLGLDIKEAASQLNADFGLGLDQETPPNRADVRQAQEDKALAASLDAWMKQAQDTLARRFRLFRAWREAYQPINPDAPFHPKFIRACGGIDHTESLLDEIEAARTLDEKIGFYKFYRKEVERYELELQTDGGADENGT